MRSQDKIPEGYKWKVEGGVPLHISFCTPPPTPPSRIPGTEVGGVSFGLSNTRSLVVVLIDFLKLRTYVTHYKGSHNKTINLDNHHFYLFLLGSGGCSSGLFLTHNRSLLPPHSSLPLQRGRDVPTPPHSGPLSSTPTSSSRRLYQETRSISVSDTTGVEGPGGDSPSTLPIKGVDKGTG